MIFNISCISNYLCLKFIFIYLTIYLDKAKITLDFILLDSRQAFQFWAYFWKQWACYCERFPRANWKILKHSKATWCVSNRRSTLAAGPHYFFSLCIFSNNNKNYNNNKKKTIQGRFLCLRKSKLPKRGKIAVYVIVAIHPKVHISIIVAHGSLTSQKLDRPWTVSCSHGPKTLFK